MPVQFTAALPRSRIHGALPGPSGPGGSAHVGGSWASAINLESEILRWPPLRPSRGAAAGFVLRSSRRGLRVAGFVWRAVPSGAGLDFELKTSACSSASWPISSSLDAPSDTAFQVGYTDTCELHGLT